MSVQMRTILEVADNSGARKLQVILPLGGGLGKKAGLGDVVTAAVIDRLLQRIKDEVGAQRGRHAPSDDPPREDVNHKRDVDEAAPCGDVGEVRDPELIRPRRGELPVDQVGRAIGRRT